MGLIVNVVNNSPNGIEELDNLLFDLMGDERLPEFEYELCYNPTCIESSGVTVFPSVIVGDSVTSEVLKVYEGGLSESEFIQDMNGFSEMASDGSGIRYDIVKDIENNVFIIALIVVIILVVLYMAFKK